MKIVLRLLLLNGLLGAAVWLTGCNSFESRTKEKAEVYNSLNQNTQERLERGTINVGDTQDMVYIALGTPDERREHTTSDGTQTIWIYKTYWERYEGTEWAGWRRVIVPARNGRGYVVFHEPVTRNVYSTNVDETIRVAFRNGHVSSVEQLKR